MAVLVGKKAPAINSKAVINGGEIVENFTLSQFEGKKHVIFFFYPADFTFVCPTEIIAFQDKIAEFEKRNVAVVGCSTDTEFSHWKWLQTDKKDGGIKGVKFPLVADVAKTIAENYDVLAGEYDYDDEDNAVFVGTPLAYRGLFLIDKEGIGPRFPVPIPKPGPGASRTPRPRVDTPASPDSPRSRQWPFAVAPRPGLRPLRDP